MLSRAVFGVTVNLQPAFARIGLQATWNAMTTATTGSHVDLVFAHRQQGLNPLQVNSVLLHNLEADVNIPSSPSFGRTSSNGLARTSSGINRVTCGKKASLDNAYLASTHVPPLLRFRSELSNAVWDSISSLYRDKGFPEVIDIDCTYGRAGVQLARRGFRVTCIEPDVQLLAKARLSASVEGVELNLLGAEQEKNRLATGSAELVTVMHGFHFLHAPSALPEMHRLLKPGGFLVVAWNDRDVDDTLVQDLEDLMEGMSPSYDRSHRLHDPEHWLPILTEGGLFSLQSFEQHANTMKLRQVSELVELLSSMRFMKSAFDSSPDLRKQFAHDTRSIVLRHCNSLEQITLPVVSKVYILRRE